ncbi:helix-turn-helix domain-containing protein [Solihabitans fulvus]|uniref:Helix-turn-helix domain-containing protein n=1 Tax=Solihabitans fulvus TaxID=1892852 RepID=A0A5B2WPM0_9PSEU|nr:helix-turn-helix transcriptional regulator [Solihabitans fulvus]KAA2252662.1 helix-turn-helix domain-containing protein [Solihabitans fulvus]
MARRDDSPDNSAIVQRMQLGRALRSYRKEAGLSRDEAARLIEVDGSTLTRKENGQQQTFKQAEIRILATAYKIPDGALDELLDLAKQTRASVKRGDFPNFVPAKTRAFLEWEPSASEIMVVTIDLIPLYFQTAGYMRELWLGNGDVLSEARIDELCAVRQRRQEAVRESGAVIHCIVHELALRVVVGGRDTMHEQLLALAAACDQENVTIQVQPMNPGSYPAMGTAFYVLRFNNEPTRDQVEIAGADEAFYRDTFNATKAYRVAWGRKQIAALDARASKALILGAADDFAP